MKEKEFTESMAYLGLAYGKEFSQSEIMQYYDFLKEYNDTTLTTAIKNLIRKSKFLPKITELIEECENSKDQIFSEVVKYMIDDGYFKDDSEISKAQLYVETKNIPGWFRPILNEYYRKMATARLEQSNQKLLS